MTFERAVSNPTTVKIPMRGAVVIAFVCHAHTLLDATSCLGGFVGATISRVPCLRDALSIKHNAPPGIWHNIPNRVAKPYRTQPTLGRHVYPGRCFHVDGLTFGACTGGSPHIMSYLNTKGVQCL